MKRIQSKISLEPMTSRLPSILPAYKDNVLYFFDKDSISERNGLYTSNYGMIPINICLDKVSGCGEYDFSCNGNVLSWERFSEYYKFFSDYYNLLKRGGHCGIVYSSATQYYDNEYYSKYSSQMKHGTDRETYVELDNLFHERGGCVKVTDTDCGIDVEDNGIFSFFKERIVPSFDIPQDYIDYWNVTCLFYPDVIKWISWFYPRVKKYGDADYSDCSDTDSCCDCVEYIDRGGKEMYDLLSKWYDGIQDKILKNLDSFDGNCYIPYSLGKVSITNSIYDLGLESTLAEEYEVGVDYRHGKYGDIENSKGGTVVSMSGDSLVLNENYTGFKYDSELLEKQYDGEAFSSYTDKYISNNLSEFAADNYSYYAYNANNQKITGKTKQEVEENLSIKYPLEKVNAYVHNSSIFNVMTSEYGYCKLSNGKKMAKILIHRENNTNTPYVVIGNKQIYADFQVNKGIGVFMFANVFDKNGNKWTSTRGDHEETLEYIIDGGTMMSIEDCESSANTIPYYRISGYTSDESIDTLYASGGSVFTSDEYGILSKYENASSDNKYAYVNVSSSFTIYTSDEMSGTTSSKLSSLASSNLMTDDAGNTLNALVNTLSRDSSGKLTTYFIQPKEGEELEPIYQIGNTANVMPYKYTVTDMDFFKLSGATVNYFVGDIITDMKFYYEYYPYSDSRTEIIEDTVFQSSGSSLEAIQKANRAYVEYCEKYPNMVTSKNVKCDITYYIGATLYREKGGKMKLLNENEISKKTLDYVGETEKLKGDNGIRYNETIEFVRDITQYFLRKPSEKELEQRALSDKNNVYYAPLSYPVYTYNAVQQENEVENTDGGVDTYPIASFYCKMNVFNNKKWKYSDYDVETYNNMQVFPTYREEYMQGIATIPSIDSDIYIDRGINAAFEKHLKLGEVTTLEALENYTNGYYKMMTQ